MDDWARKSGGSPGHKEFEALRSMFSRSMPKVPEDTIAALFTTFLSRYAQGVPEATNRALQWLAGVGSLLLCDYDGTPFTKDEWTEIRELVTIDSGEIDIETLTYVLGQTLEHSAL